MFNVVIMRYYVHMSPHQPKRNVYGTYAHLFL